jgi:hypothetical protein
MRRRLLIGAGLAVALAIATIVYYKTRQLSTPEQILARLPTDDASVLSIDFAMLRKGGVFEMLNGPVIEEEPEYTAFVKKTGFNYQRDLDHAFVAFHPTGVYFLVTGRFDWKRLEAYARDEGGGCYNGLCRMQGSQPSRKISYFPLKSNLMALAVSPDDWGATRMSENRNARPIGIQQEPVWLSLPSSTLKKSETFPTGTQLFAKAMEDAQSATLSLAPAGKAIEARLDVVCRSAQEASILTAQFQKVTSVLRELIAKQHQKPGPAEMASVLIAGVFRQDGVRVTGRWPIERAFLEHLAGK